MADDTTPPSQPNSSCSSDSGTLNFTGAYILVSIFMGLRLVMTGAEKLRKDGAYAYANWTGPADGFTEDVPLGAGLMGKIGTAMTTYTSMKAPMVKMFLYPLPALMLAAGVLILIGTAARIKFLGPIACFARMPAMLGWFLGGLIWISLSFGQMLLPDEPTIQQLLFYVLTCALGMALLGSRKCRA